MNQNQSENINELATALAKAQGEFTPAIKDAANPFYKSKYANLCSVYKACQQPLSKNGLSISQSTIRDEQNNWILITKLLHGSGQWMSSQTPIITAKADIQSFGSAITYSRRYALSAIVGVVTDEDDDGNINVDDPRSKTVVNKPKPLAIDKPAETFNPNYITTYQVTEFIDLVAKCKKENQPAVWKFLEDAYGIINLQHMTLEIFDKMKTKINKSLEVAKNETN